MYSWYVVFLLQVDGLQSVHNHWGVDSMSDERSNCIWYDQCGTDQTTGKPLNCLFTDPAPEMKDPQGLKLLKKLCPQLVTGIHLASHKTLKP